MLSNDLRADLNATDDEGGEWSRLLHAVDPMRIRPGTVLVAGFAEISIGYRPLRGSCSSLSASTRS